MPRSIKGRRFLITQYRLSEYTGSEVLSLELAEYLISAGAQVTAYAYFIDQPIADDFRNAGVRITDNPADLDLAGFDYIWVHHQTFPEQFFGELNSLIAQRKPPQFIFLHMSPFDYVPNEFPYLYKLEEAISARSLFVSPETLAAQRAHYYHTDQFGLFRNPAPVAYSQYESPAAPADYPRQILVVSNHPPQELIEATSRLAATGRTKCTFLGEGQVRYGRITPELLSHFDLVVTIGKTVQYCLCMGLPVYVYDHFGGDGFLTAENYELVRDLNFSGRKVDAAGASIDNHKSADYISQDILGNFAARAPYYRQQRSAFIAEFSIDQVLPAILDSLQPPRTIPKFDQPYLLAARDVCQLTKFYSSELCKAQRHHKSLTPPRRPRLQRAAAALRRIYRQPPRQA